MTDDPRLSQLIKEGINGDIVIVGFPSYQAAKRENLKGGIENGPCCLRRFYPKVGPLVNPYYEIDISKLSVTDMGNIEVQGLSVEDSTNLLRKRLRELLDQKKIPIIFGGSKETSYASTLYHFDRHKKGKAIYLYGHPCTRRPFDHDKLTSLNIISILSEQYRYRITLIGSDEKYFGNEIKLTSMPTIVNRYQLRQVPYEKYAPFPQPRTQLTTLLTQILQQNPYSPYIVSISVYVLKNFMGSNHPIHGCIYPYEMLYSMFYLGRSPHIHLIDITYFNPSAYDYNSSLFIMNMVYYFLMGYAKR